MMLNQITNSNERPVHYEPLVHPGKILSEELEKRDLKKSAFAMKIRLYPSHFGDLLKGKRNVSPSIALKLEEELGLSAEYWLGLQLKYDLGQERLKLQTA